MPEILRFYHNLPYPLRVVAASARGYYLRWWRYGTRTCELRDEAVERESWSSERWRYWQEERVAYVLHRAATQVPFYRSMWQRRRRLGDRASHEVLGNWPLLDKQAVREQPLAFVAEDCDPRLMFEEHTSGTTGTPLRLWWSRDTVMQYYALYEARVREWHGVNRHDRWAILGGQIVTSVAQRQPPFWVWNQGLKQLYLSSYHISSETARSYVDALRQHRVEYIIGYPSAMEALARGILEHDLDISGIGVAVSNAEPLYEHQRALIGEAFRCTVRDTYGMAEIVSMASECSLDTMHFWPEIGITEVLKDSRMLPVGSGEAGRFVCTGLLNADMPLIRYEVGDRGRVDAISEACICGRSMPVLAEVQGRMDDVVWTSDGRAVGRLDPVFKTDLPVREAQIVQDAIGSLQVKVVPADGYTDSHSRTIVRRLRDRVGDLQIDVQSVSHIPRTKNGKLRGVISNVLPPEFKNVLA